MFIYLASRYSRIDEMKVCKVKLERDGHIVTSRWVLGNHQWDGSSDDDTSPGADLARKYAIEDIEDIEASEAVFCFTEPARTRYTRGGRHVEFGYGYAIGKEMVVIGPVENVFYSLPGVKQFESFAWARMWAKETDKEWQKMRGLMSSTGLPPQLRMQGGSLRLSSSPDSDIGTMSQP